ncbi:MAG: hypothetical protein KZQ60_03330 [Candidatus Thiodiazotropha sp. (ex Lucinoma aequizonata)]|nr:hypothetical protein [Candidatus Thiodiazotropha sp. (ex Lucinoma aequizonata)]
MVIKVPFYRVNNYPDRVGRCGCMPFISPFRSPFRPYNRAYAYRGLTVFVPLSMAVSV